MMGKGGDAEEEWEPNEPVQNEMWIYLYEIHTMTIPLSNLWQHEG